MARFILDVDTKDIQAVLDLLDRDSFLASKVATIKCIDETNDNQFHDDYGTDNANMNFHNLVNELVEMSANLSLKYYNYEAKQGI